MNIKKLNKNHYYILTANLLANIGNGLHTMALGSLLYSYTGSSISFGVVYILEASVNIFLQMFAGSATDNYKSKSILLIADSIRGLCIVLCCALAFLTNKVFLFVTIMTILINIVKPFSRSASFVIVTRMSSDGQVIEKFNSVQSSVIQAGQLIGLTLVGILLRFISPFAILIFDGIFYIISAFFVGLIDSKSLAMELTGERSKKMSVKQFIEEWIATGRILITDKVLLVMLLLTTGDYLFVNFFNLSIAPLVSIYFNNNSLWISVLEMSFAIASLLPGVILAYLTYKFERKNIQILMITFSLLSFIFMATTLGKTFAVVLTFTLGFATTTSNILLYTKVQKQSPANIRGKVASLRNMLVSLFTILCVPIVTTAQDSSLNLGFLVSGSVVLVYLFVTIIFLKRKIINFTLEEGKNE